MRKQPAPYLRPVRDVEAPLLQYRTIHGYRRAFRVAGSGPALLLIHGVGCNSKSWEPVHAKLAQRFTVIAPDLLGHGESDKPHADYSLPAFANGMRDLLAVLGIDRVTVVGHSFGGGVAMQFAYQYPELVERIVLVNAGGVSKDVSLALRLAAMPMGAEALAMLRAPGVMPAIRGFGRAVGAVLGSTRLGRDVTDVVEMLEGFQDPAGLAAFARTLRSVVDASGQYVTMLDRLSRAIRSGADNLGRRRLDHPGGPCPHGTRGDSRFAHGDLRRLWAHAVPRPPGSLRRGRRAVHRLDPTGRLRPEPHALPAADRRPRGSCPPVGRRRADGVGGVLTRQRTAYLGAGIQHQQDQGAQGVVGQAATGKVVAQHHVRDFGRILA